MYFQFRFAIGIDLMDVGSFAIRTFMLLLYF